MRLRTPSNPGTYTCAQVYTSRRRPNTRVADDVLRVANSPCRHVRSNQGTRRGMRSHSCSADRGRPGRGCRASGGGGGATWTLLTPETFARLPRGRVDRQSPRLRRACIAGRAGMWVQKHWLTLQRAHAPTRTPAPRYRSAHTLDQSHGKRARLARSKVCHTPGLGHRLRQHQLTGGTSVKPAASAVRQQVSRTRMTNRLSVRARLALSAGEQRTSSGCALVKLGRASCLRESSSSSSPFLPDPP